MPRKEIQRGGDGGNQSIRKKFHTILILFLFLHWSIQWTSPEAAQVPERYDRADRVGVASHTREPIERQLEEEGL